LAQGKDSSKKDTSCNEARAISGAKKYYESVVHVAKKKLRRLA